MIRLVALLILAAIQPFVWWLIYAELYPFAKLKEINSELGFACIFSCVIFIIVLIFIVDLDKKETE